jgi:hypothetical protein
MSLTTKRQVAICHAVLVELDGTGTPGH